MGRTGLMVKAVLEAGPIREIPWPTCSYLILAAISTTSKSDLSILLVHSHLKVSAAGQPWHVQFSFSVQLL